MAKTKMETQSGCVGLGVHLLDEIGEVEFQGHIIRMDGETVLVELFGWGMGEAYRVVAVKKDIIYSSTTATLYESVDQMNYWFEAGQGSTRMRLVLSLKRNPSATLEEVLEENYLTVRDDEDSQRMSERRYFEHAFDKLKSKIQDLGNC